MTCKQLLLRPEPAVLSEAYYAVVQSADYCLVKCYHIILCITRILLGGRMWLWARIVQQFISSAKTESEGKKM